MLLEFLQVATRSTRSSAARIYIAATSSSYLHRSRLFVAWHLYCHFALRQLKTHFRYVSSFPLIRCFFSRFSFTHSFISISCSPLAITLFHVTPLLCASYGPCCCLPLQRFTFTQPLSIVFSQHLPI